MEMRRYISLREKVRTLAENADNLAARELHRVDRGGQPVHGYHDERYKGYLEVAHELTKILAEVEAEPGHWQTDLPKVTRVEVIGDGGRLFQLWGCLPGVELHVQDSEMTLKVFVTGDSLGRRRPNGE